MKLWAAESLGFNFETHVFIEKLYQLFQGAR